MQSLARVAANNPTSLTPFAPALPFFNAACQSTGEDPEADGNANGFLEEECKRSVHSHSGYPQRGLSNSIGQKSSALEHAFTKQVVLNIAYGGKSWMVENRIMIGIASDERHIYHLVAHRGGLPPEKWTPQSSEPRRGDWVNDKLFDNDSVRPSKRNLSTIP